MSLEGEPFEIGVTEKEDNKVSKFHSLVKNKIKEILLSEIDDISKAEMELERIMNIPATGVLLGSEMRDLYKISEEQMGVKADEAAKMIRDVAKAVPITKKAKDNPKIIDPRVAYLYKK